MKSMCDCPRQSFDFDSLRGAPPSSPGEGLAPWDNADTNVPRFRPCGRMAADCRRYTRYVQRYTQCSGVDPTPSSPGEGLAPWDNADTNVPRFRPCGRMAADCRRYTRYVQRYTQCSGVDPTPLQPRRGAGPVGQCGYKRTTAPALWAGWRQIAAATVGGTIFWVIPFIPTGYTSNVAGG